MIALHRLDHVALRVTDLDEASRRWSLQFGLTERERDGGSSTLVCDDEPRALVLQAARRGEHPGFARVGWELSPDCSLEDAAAHLDGLGIAEVRHEDRLELADPDGNEIWVLPYAEPASRMVPHARPAPGAATWPPRHPWATRLSLGARLGRPRGRPRHPWATPASWGMSTS